MSGTSVNITDSTTGSAPEGSGADANAAAMANLYLLLAKAFSLPGGLDLDMGADLEVLIPNLPESLRDSAEVFARNWQQETSDSKKLSLAFSRLFLGPFEIMAPPYASFYLEPDQRVMGEVSSWVAGQYAGAGLEPGEGPREVPDHVSLECEYMYFLMYQQLTTGEKKWRTHAREFLRQHMNQWVPVFTDTVRKAVQHPFYDSAADVLNKLVSCDHVLED